MPSDLASTEPSEARTTGALIVNADDWGRDAANTTRTLECIRAGAVSSVSAMVFMEDSERAAEIANSSGIDAGLHLNLDSAFTAAFVPTALARNLQQLARYLQRRRIAQAIYHPGLAKSFEYVVAAQLDEFARLYGRAPRRIDGHHHMHLCENIVRAKLLPAGTLVRRNFSFEAGEKSFANRLYRRFVDGRIASRHILTDYFFSLVPFETAGRLEKICALAEQFFVEVETHPVKLAEYEFLTNDGFRAFGKQSHVAKHFATRNTSHATARNRISAR